MSLVRSTVERIVKESEGKGIVDCKCQSLSRCWGTVGTQHGSSRTLDEGYIMGSEPKEGLRELRRAMRMP